jgi:hypothetical protein
VPKDAAAANLLQVVRSLRAIAETLQYAHQSFADAQLRQPRPEDYEPLTAPLREFAKIAPALVEVLRGLVQSAAPLAGLVSLLGESVHTLSAAPAGGGRPYGPSDEVLRRVETAHEAVREALSDLPGESDYAPVAAQLRELATVSPSLMDWLREVPRLAAPLRGSVQALRRAAEELQAARTLLGGEPSA